MSSSTTISVKKPWSGGDHPMNASYGKMMMWFFILSDALSFSGFLASYGFSRFKFIDSWPIADEVFTHFPFMHGQDMPMFYVALMTFVLIFSSVTMVLAVDAGHHMKKNKVIIYMLLTIVGGLIFVGSQAWEWKNFIKGEYGAVETNGGQILHFIDSKTNKRIALHRFAEHLPSEKVELTRSTGFWFSKSSKPTEVSLNEVLKGFKSHENIVIRTEKVNSKGEKILLNRSASEHMIKNASRVVEGANLEVNEYGNPLFADYFFFITGFHGFHVFSGVVINIIIFLNVLVGTYEKRGHYEMIEKVGLYWHFVDLVWVFVFTFFYLV